MAVRNGTGKRLDTVRRFLAVISAIVTIYYLYWRVTETFNPDAPVFSWTLYGAEVYGAFTTFLFFFTAWKLKDRTPLPPLQDRRVDIFIPTKSEPTAILRKTLLACGDVRYPHRTLVLDDGNRPEVRDLCKELDCIYLARGTSEGAKAGNLNYGLAHSNAEFIAVFDADHVPLPTFVERLIGFFADDKVAFVQTPQEFYNVDSFQHRLDRKNKYIWGEQYLFFSLIQPGKDHWNSAYFVGSCALMRRKALDDVGGFATGCITEDMLTSLRMHGKGWASIYLNENLAYGIAAETILPFHVQRQRWGIGNWQIFFKSNPLLMRGLTFPQRLNYLSSMIYPLEGIQKIIFYATPPVAIFTGLLPMRALDINYVLHFVPYFILSSFAFNEMARGYGGQLMLEQFSMGKYFTYLRSMWLFLVPKARSEFKVTPKGVGGRMIPFTFIVPQMLVLLASFLAVGFAVYGLAFGLRSDNFVVAVNCFWAIYNSGLAMAIIQYDYRKLYQRRSQFRIPDALPVVYWMDKDGDAPPGRSMATAENLTEEGASLILFGQLLIGRTVNLSINLPGTTAIVRGRVIRERSISVDGIPVSIVGISFIDVPRELKDFLTRYLHESAVAKFLREYSTRYTTYLERRFQAERHFTERAYRALTYLPTLVQDGKSEEGYGVIRDISETGLLMTVGRPIAQGMSITVRVVCGQNSINLNGLVVREIAHDTVPFTHYLVGVRLTEESVAASRRLLALADAVGGFVLE
jgi:cellulose synthase (UDP-forming)